MIGLSPTRPATFHEIPLVVVTEPMSPFAATAFMLIVPKVCGTPRSSRKTWLSSPYGADAPWGVGLTAGRRDGALSSGTSSQLSFGLRRDFHLSHASRDLS